MRDFERELQNRLENELKMLQAQDGYWGDPRVVGLEDLSGTLTSAREIREELKVRIFEVERLLKDLRGSK